MDLARLLGRLNAIGGMQGAVTEAEEKCSKCGCTPCECDDKDKVEEGKKPDFLDADNDGNKKETMSDALDDKEEKVKESALDLLRRHAGIQEAAPVNFDKVLDAIAALHGDDMWDNDAMQDLAHDLEQQNPTDQELDSIIATGKLPQRLANTQFTNNDSVQFGEALNTSKLADTMGVDAQRLRGAVARATAGKQSRSDIMLLSDTFVKLLNNPDDTAIQAVANLIKSGNVGGGDKPENTRPNIVMKQEGNEFSGALEKAKAAGEEEFEVGGKKYKVNECGDDMAMSPMTAMAASAGAPEETKDRYTLTITKADGSTLNATTDMPQDIAQLIKLAGIPGTTSVSNTPVPTEEPEVEEAFGNTPAQTQEREPRLHGDTKSWGLPGTARAQVRYTPPQQGDNPMKEEVGMFEEYKVFKESK
jgi:hypothetical protein